MQILNLNTEGEAAMCKKCGCENPYRGRFRKISTEEIDIISRAVYNAKCWGTGIVTACQEEIEAYDYEWTEAHEHYVFKTYIDQ
jgi:hypothetical protein